MLQLLEHVEGVRRTVSPRIAQHHKSEFGQFMTPSSIARFMAAMFPVNTIEVCRLLDAGAGVGALTCAFLDRWKAGDFTFKNVEATAYEIDDALRPYLKQHLASYTDVQANVFAGDFISQAANEILEGTGGYTHAILNPPYKKIGSKSEHRLALRQAGIETVNLYSAFVALAVALSAPGSQIVAIIPRSFCNGPYYRPFREFVLSRTAIRQMHLFASRSKAFKDDAVLQENIIIRLERGGAQGPVTISTSTDDSFSDLVTHSHPFDRIVFPNDESKFIHVPTSQEINGVELPDVFNHSLADLGLSVSTGPVVDFRVKEHLSDMPDESTAPLLYPGHFGGSGIEWPKAGLKKPNAIRRNADTEKWLYPNGFYCVVRRFSAKEEKRRIVASLVNPAAFDGNLLLGFENHLNVFHVGKRGLPQALAAGLTAFLNSTAVDVYFRRFNGHTQVNATDLKQMRYPSLEMLLSLGEWAMKAEQVTTGMIDWQLENLTA